MLTDPRLCPQDPILSIIGGGSAPKRLDVGVYQIGHFSFDMMLCDEDDWDPYCDGVCDSVEQFMRKYGETLKGDAAEYCLSFTRIAKDEQSPEGGWRWHKWGEYVGDGEPTTEYLYHEPKFTEVYVFHVFRKRSAVGGEKDPRP